LTWRDRFPSLAAVATETPPEGCGLYFLIRSGVIVYVGSSRHPSRRVWSHQRSRKVRKLFDAVVYLPVEDPKDLLDIEVRWIRAIRPIYNQAGNPSRAAWAGGWG
jgi:excinuclease UvrABC nuclease subunit